MGGPSYTVCEGEQGISNGQVVFEFVRGAHGVFATGGGFSTQGRGGRAYDKQCWLYLNLYLYWPQEVRRRKHVMMMRISFYNFETILQGKGEAIWPSLLASTFCVWLQNTMLGLSSSCQAGST